jgi:hypothetical protein
MIGNHATRALIARKLTPEDQKEFERLLREQLGLGPEDAFEPPLAKMFQNACARLTSLEEVNKWLVDRSSLLADYGKTSKAAATATPEEVEKGKKIRAEREAKQPSLAPWVAPDRLVGAVHPYASMSEEWSVGTQQMPIVWTAGAAACVAVGLYTPGKAALCHIDPQKIGQEGQPLPAWFSDKLYEFKGGDLHMAAGQAQSFLDTLQDKINELRPNPGFANTNTYKSNRLALNARNGEIRTAYNVDELNDAWNALAKH